MINSPIAVIGAVAILAAAFAYWMDKRTINRRQTTKDLAEIIDMMNALKNKKIAVVKTEKEKYEESVADYNRKYPQSTITPPKRPNNPN